MTAHPHIYRRNPLHPTTLYLSHAWWTDQRGSVRPPPAPNEADRRGIERLRVCLPDDIQAPSGWSLCKTTRLGQMRLTTPKEDFSCGLTIRRLQRNSDELARWIDLHRQLYAETHRDNPVAPLSDDDARKLFAGEDLHPNAILAGFDGDSMVGVSSLRSVSDDTLELGWTGLPGRIAPQETACLVAVAAARAQELRRDAIAVEADDTDRALTAALRRFDIEWSETFRTYELTCSPAEEHDQG